MKTKEIKIENLGMGKNKINNYRTIANLFVAGSLVFSAGKMIGCSGGPEIDPGTEVTFCGDSGDIKYKDLNVETHDCDSGFRLKEPFYYMNTTSLYNDEGWDVNGFDKEGYDKDGKDKNGNERLETLGEYSNIEELNIGNLAPLDTTSQGVISDVLRYIIGDLLERTSNIAGQYSGVPGIGSSFSTINDYISGDAGHMFVNNVKTAHATIIDTMAGSLNGEAAEDFRKQIGAFQDYKYLTQRTHMDKGNVKKADAENEMRRIFREELGITEQGLTLAQMAERMEDMLVKSLKLMEGMGSMQNKANAAVAVGDLARYNGWISDVVALEKNPTTFQDKSNWHDLITCRFDYLANVKKKIINFINSTTP